MIQAFNRSFELRKKLKIYVRIIIYSESNIVWLQVKSYYASAASMQFEDSQVLTEAGYEIGDWIGSRSFGNVYEATHCSSRRRFAIKSIDRYHVYSDVEVYILKNYSHSNIMGSLDVIESSQGINIVLPFMNGSDLRNVMRHHAPFSELCAKGLFAQILEGLAYLESCFIIHHDMKPGNILCHVNSSGEYTLKISDFGLSKFMTSSYVEGRSLIKGTPRYAAPEHIRGECYDTKIDVWACGIILYEMLTGSSPFKGHSREERMENMKRGRYSKSCLHHVSDLAKDLIRNMLQRDPDYRLSATDAKYHAWFDE